MYKGNKNMDDRRFFPRVSHDLDKKMAARNRKILVSVDQCSAHPKDCNFNNVAVRFLPTNTMSRLQPLDAGLIQNVKRSIKGLLLRRILPKIEWQDENLRISLLDALHFLAVPWDNVTQNTIANCFRKC